MRSPSAWLLALVVLLSQANLWITFRRSGIPMALTGRVERVEVRREKHPGLDDVHLVTIAGRTVHLDAATAYWLRVGDDVRKPAWSRTLATPRGPRTLVVSTDLERMALAMPLVVVIALVLLRRRRAAPADGAGPDRR